MTAIASVDRVSSFSDILCLPLEACGRKWRELPPVEEEVSLKKIASIAQRLILSIGIGLAVIPGFVGACIKFFSPQQRKSEVFTSGKIPLEKDLDERLRDSMPHEATSSEIGKIIRMFPKCKQAPNVRVWAWTDKYYICELDCMQITFCLESIRPTPLDVLKRVFTQKYPRSFEALREDPRFISLIVSRLLGAKTDSLSDEEKEFIYHVEKIHDRKIHLKLPRQLNPERVFQVRIGGDMFE